MAQSLMRIFCLPLLFATCSALWIADPCQAARPSEELLPNTTKGFLSVPNMDLLRQKWRATLLGQLAADPVMKPFAEDLQRQLRSKLSKTDARIGMSWPDLDGVSWGEVCVAVVQPWDRKADRAAVAEAAERAAAKAQAAGKNPQEIAVIRLEAEEAAKREQDKKRQEQHALVMLVDVTGHVAEANALLDKVAERLIQRGAAKSATKIAGVDMVVLNIPAETSEGSARQAYFGVHQDQLVATDSQQAAACIMDLWQGKRTDSLAKTKPFQVTMKRTRDALHDIQPQVRWFVEPFGITEVIRAYSGGRKKRGTDTLKVLGNQGFTAIQGLGGHIAFSTGEHEIMHRTFVYAPPVKRAADSKETHRYDLAARMLDFPNSTGLHPESWVPRELATYVTFNWKMQQAFWAAETLVNEFAGDEVFRDVLKSIETDPNGPQINIETELVAHLGERASLIADCRIPVTPKSERVLVAIELTNPEAVLRTVNKAMESDPQARKIEHQGHIIWEMVNEEPVEVEEVKIDGVGFGFDVEQTEEVVEEEKPFRPNAAVTVVQGHLVVSSHVDYIVEHLDRPADTETLEADGEYQLVSMALDKLGAGDDSLRFFTRTDEAYRATYELVRQGKMPEAETLLGKLLNRLFEPEEEDVQRAQFIDGSQLPDYQIVRRYLGPAGSFSRTEDEGWSMTGCLLTKDAK